MSIMKEKVIVNKLIDKISLTPNFFAINSPPPIVIIHAGHIVYDEY